jgi:ribonuclease G
VNIELVINASPKEVVIAILKDRVLTELHREKNNKDFSVGDLYLGKVKRIIPNLNAAFVNVGFEKDAFLHYLDLGPQFASLDKFTKSVLRGQKNNGSLDKFSLEKDIDKDGKIKDILSSGQDIVVQIAKEPISSKGPRLTSEVTIAGRYLVLVPFNDKISISQKIASADERKRLVRLLTSIKPKNFGVIIRTVAENKKVAELDADLRELINRWESCYKNLKNGNPPKKILGELNRSSAILRDMLSSEFTNIHIDSEETYEELKEYLESIAPDKAKILKLYKGKSPIFEHFGIQKQIKASFGKHVAMKSGAYLIIEHTEAMHVIDVNSGNRKSIGQSQEENALETNIEAAKEIARILKLRDMGGIIAVDFIDLLESKNQKKLFETLKESLREDRAKHHVLPPSKFGVVEITRQRVRPETEIKTSETCPTCGGTGEVQATILIIDEIENNLRYLIEDLKVKSIALQLHPFIESYLTKGIWSIQKKWFMKYKRWIPIRPMTAFHLLQYNFVNAEGDKIEI